MGYNVNATISNVNISAINENACLAAINKMFDREVMKKNASGRSFSLNNQDWSLDNIYYSWVQTPKNGFTSLVDAFREWGYETLIYNGDRLNLEYRDSEKWGDDEQLFATIAPFVESVGMITILGEDGAHWRYIFDNGKIRHEIGHIVWKAVQEI